MDDLGERLTDCFLAVFPDLARGEVSRATSLAVPGWDSVAGVTLLAVVEEEFGIVIEVPDLSALTSYEGYLMYLQNESSSGRSSVYTVSSQDPA
jgi:acyl carrier protein